MAMTDADKDINEILYFWFGEGRTTREVCAEKNSLWWSKDEEVDAEIRARFADTTAGVYNGVLDRWQENSEGMLASIIALDQFPRNMFRGTAKSFAFDPRALEFAHWAVAQNMDSRLTPVRRVFVYMPFEHSEDIKDQDLCVNLFRQLLDEAPTEDRQQFADWLDFAERHREIIRRFGRFPHRNEILERPSTAEEREFLTRPGSSF